MADKCDCGKGEMCPQFGSEFGKPRQPIKTVVEGMSGADAKKALSELTKMTPEQALRELNEWCAVEQTHHQRNDPDPTVQRFFRKQGHAFITAVADMQAGRDFLNTARNFPALRR